MVHSPVCLSARRFLRKVPSASFSPYACCPSFAAQINRINSQRTDSWSGLNRNSRFSTLPSVAAFRPRQFLNLLQGHKARSDVLRHLVSNASGCNFTISVSTTIAASNYHLMLQTVSKLCGRREHNVGPVLRKLSAMHAMESAAQPTVYRTVEDAPRRKP